MTIYPEKLSLYITQNIFPVLFGSQQVIYLVINSPFLYSACTLTIINNHHFESDYH